MRRPRRRRRFTIRPQELLQRREILIWPVVSRQLRLLNNGQVLIVGGWSTAAAELFDPSTGTFALTGSVQEARVGQQATLLADGTVLVAGGSAPFDGIYSVEVYDPAAKSFGSKSAFLKAARTDHAAAQLADGRLLLTGGEDFALERAFKRGNLRSYHWSFFLNWVDGASAPWTHGNVVAQW